MLFYRNESSLDEMLFQCFLADKSANQAAHQSSSNNDYQHGNRSDIEHSLNVLRGNIVFLHCANKRTLKKFDIKGALAQIWQLQRYILSSQR